MQVAGEMFNEFLAFPFLVSFNFKVVFKEFLDFHLEFFVESSIFNELVNHCYFVPLIFLLLADLCENAANTRDSVTKYDGTA